MEFQNKKILVIVAHPDDELLGCGATMHRLIHEHGCIVRALILGEGLTSRSDVRDTEKWKGELSIHRSDIEDARKIIGYDSVEIYAFPDNRFDSVDLLDIIKVIEKDKAFFQPEIIFTHHGGDLNIDHQRTFEAVITACRPIIKETVKSIITFETPSSTEWRSSSDPKHFIPNLFFSISEDNLNAKISAMQSYSFEKREFPHPRSPQALRNRVEMWGIVNGINLAEAFQIIRSME